MTQRRAIWKQPDPRMQLVTVLGAVQGDVHYVLERAVHPAFVKERIQDLFEQALELLKLVKGEWPKRPCRKLGYCYEHEGYHSIRKARRGAVATLRKSRPRVRDPHGSPVTKARSRIPRRQRP